MLNPFDRENISREIVIRALARIRQEWQETTPGSLVDVEASLGLLLADLASYLCLTPQEQAEALGRDLYQEINTLLMPA
jgi:hypothetical protein